jgi:hypothetical protein
MDCPNSIYDDPKVRNEYPHFTVVNSTIPLQTLQPFDTAVKGSTIASPTNIEYRNWYLDFSDYVDNGMLNPYGLFKLFQSFTLTDQYHIIEGLIVDATNGGIGFRNHSIPIDLELGAQWTEDILWITPETACTLTNLSLHFSLKPNSFSSYWQGYIRDDGGFANISPIVPNPRWDTDTGWREVGPVPDLQGRADIAARWNNQFTGLILNVSNPKVGMTYNNESKAYTEVLSSTSSIGISQIDGGFLDTVRYNYNNSWKNYFGYYGMTRHLTFFVNSAN